MQKHCKTREENILVLPRAENEFPRKSEDERNAVQLYVQEMQYKRIPPYDVVPVLRTLHGNLLSQVYCEIR